MEVFPTCVGMNRCGLQFQYRYLGVPHVCGDEPPSAVLVEDAARCSPRVWG